MSDVLTILNRLAYFFGEVNSGNNPVEWVRLNPQDVRKLETQLPVPVTNIWAARVIEDPTLRPGNCQIDKLGKRPLY